ncbi:TetR/AcrR family transcriptional regulator [Lacisediminihabitans sp. FW035]
MARAGLTPGRIISAAADLADTDGFENVSMSAVARHFEVKDASLYAHVRNLHELRSGVAVLSLTELADQVGAALAGRAGRDALVAFADAYRSYAMSHPGRYAATQMQLEPQVAKQSAAARHAAMTRAILRGYGLNEPDETDAVRLLHSTFHGFVLLERGGGFSRGPRPASASWERVLDTLHSSLSSWPSS